MAITGVSSISGQQIIAAGALSAASAGTALYDENGNSLTSYLTAVPEGYATTGDLTGKQDTLTFGYDENNAISSINESALAGGSDLTCTYEQNNITTINDSGINASTLGPQNVSAVYNASNALVICPNPSPFGTTNTGLLSPLNYATGACIASNGPSFKGYYKGNEFFVCNPMYGYVRGECNNTRGNNVVVVNSANNASAMLCMQAPTGNSKPFARVENSAAKAELYTDNLTFTNKTLGKVNTIKLNAGSASNGPSISLRDYTTSSTEYIYPSSISSWNNKQDSLTFGYDSNDAISSINESALAGGGGASYTSPLGTILVSGSTLEATNSAIGTIVDTVTVTQDNTYVSSFANYPYDSYSAHKTSDSPWLYLRYGDWGDGISVSDLFLGQEEDTIEIPLTSGGYDLFLFNGNNVVISAKKTGVTELVMKNEMYNYATTANVNELSGAISSVSTNVSALSAKTITGSNHETILFDGQNIEATISAVDINEEIHVCTPYQDSLISTSFTGGPYTSYNVMNNYDADAQIYAKYYDGDWNHMINVNQGETLSISAEYEGSALYAVWVGNTGMSMIGSTNNVVELARKNELPSSSQLLPYPMQFIATSGDATGSNILYIVTGA